jgi:hypothetical protein
MKNIKLAILALAMTSMAFGQLTTTQTTLSSAVTGNTNTQWCLASATGVTLYSLSAGTSASILFVDREAAQVMSQGASATCYNVRRGVLGTTAANSHTTLATVWVTTPATGTGDPSRPFSGGGLVPNIPAGACVASQQYTLPIIVYGTNGNVGTGEVFRCIGGYWTRGDAQNYPPASYTQFTTFPPAFATTLNTTTGVAGSVWVSALAAPFNAKLTGACILNGATVGTDKWIVSLYDGAGTLLANSALAGTTTATASAYQCIAFTATVNITGPSIYYIALQGNGTTDTFKTYAAAQAPTLYGTKQITGGIFGTLPAITPPTTFTANVGPVMTTY